MELQRRVSIHCDPYFFLHRTFFSSFVVCVYVCLLVCNAHVNVCVQWMGLVAVSLHTICTCGMQTEWSKKKERNGEREWVSEYVHFGHSRSMQEENTSRYFVWSRVTNCMKQKSILFCARLIFIYVYLMHGYIAYRLYIFYVCLCACMYDEMRTIRITNEHNREECKRRIRKWMTVEMK